MPLSPRTRLGTYEIVAPIGAGGMGEVYRARDRRLGRDVAIKVLPQAVASSPDRLARFEREARTVAGLNHPNIVTLFSVEDEDGIRFITMELLDGQTLSRLLTPGGLPLARVLELSIPIADALAAAHEHGIIHRDLKPANVMVTREGRVKVLDFGLAKTVDTGGPGRDAALATTADLSLSSEGQVMGTVPYMAPEQIRDEAVDARTDLFAFGIMLYELTTGQRPFTGVTPADVSSSILRDTPPPPTSVRADLPKDLDRIVSRCLEKDPRERFQTARDLGGELRRAKHVVEIGEHGARAFVRRWAHERRFWVTTLLLLAVLAAGSVAYVRHHVRVRWVREAALPKIREMIDGGTENYLAAYRLVEQAERYLPHDPAVQEALNQISTKATITTDPSGATVWVKPYLEREAPWLRLGETPIRDKRLPLVTMRWRVERPGFVPLLGAVMPGRPDAEAGRRLPRTYSFHLVAQRKQPADMVRVEGTGVIPEFLIDRFEVTNRQFKAFVDAGGYREQRYWKHAFTSGGRTLSWAEAMRTFVDRTGRPGPATWEAGDFAEGKGDFPVGGVSWYEAAAFAELAGKSLPTIAHWWAATGRPRGAKEIIALSNFGGKGPVPVGSTDAITRFGVADMAGNVREWCWNPSAQGRCLRGGAWNDQVYMFGNVTQAPAFDRSETNGIRCVRYLEGKEPQRELFAAYRNDLVRDFAKEKPVSDEAFVVCRRLFDYDPRDLEARVEARDAARPDWVRERVSFRAAYGDERVIAQLYLPRSGHPPYQAVVYFPGSADLWGRSSDDLDQRLSFWLFVSPLLKSGRAVLYPVYKGTYERNDGRPEYYAALHLPARATREYADYQIKLVMDVRRSLDYLSSRPDIDRGRMAYYGFSWGGVIAPLVLAVENRFSTAIIVSGGLMPKRASPEVDPFSYVSRVRLPVLMLHGRYDLTIPLESSARPMFELLATPPGDKVLHVSESDHTIPRRELIRESLAWLDRRLGPVEPAVATTAQQAPRAP